MINAVGGERRFSVSQSSPSPQQTPPPVTPRAKLSFSLQPSKWDVPPPLLSSCDVPLDRSL